VLAYLENASLEGRVLVGAQLLQLVLEASVELLVNAHGLESQGLHLLLGQVQRWVIDLREEGIVLA
jgi:hypothetical protein